MSARFTFRNSIAAMLAAPALLGAGTAYAACAGPGAPTTTETKCLTAVQIPDNPLLSWVRVRDGVIVSDERTAVATEMVR